jgi:hypothetical protein
MSGDEQAIDDVAPLGRRVAGSALSAFVGWLTLVVVLLGGTIYEGIERTHSPRFKWAGFAVMSAVAFVFVLATWLVALVPLYLFVPLRSLLWHWFICTLCGGIAGAAIMFAFHGLSFRGSGAISMVILAAITGAATCLFGALTAARFHRPKPNANGS